MKKARTQLEVVFDYYKARPNIALKHPEVVDSVTEEYMKETGKVFRDPDRAIRTLHQQGKLIKVAQGVYKYDPDFVGIDKTLQVFTEAQKREILKRGNYKCAICGKGKKENVTLHCDHIIPMDKGGTNSIENGQVLCSQHNFLKDNFKQTETGKKMFINLLMSLNQDDRNSNVLKKFLIDILKVYEKHNINSHIEFNEDCIYSEEKDKNL